MKYIIVALSVFLASCSIDFERGLRHINAGENTSAFNRFNSCASQGDSECYNAIGWMYENRRIQSAAPMKAALHYYTMAARYGNKTAQLNLVRLGYNVPSADLQRRASPEEQRQLIEAAGELGGALGRSLR